MNDYYSVIIYIKNILDDAGVPCVVVPIYEGYQLRFPWCEGDVALHDGTYGHQQLHVESYCFPWDEDDVSELTPVEAAAKIMTYYKTVKRGF
jgi:hypothetical protein